MIPFCGDNEAETSPNIELIMYVLYQKVMVLASVIVAKKAGGLRPPRAKLSSKNLGILGLVATIGARMRAATAMRGAAAYSVVRIVSAGRLGFTEIGELILVIHDE